MQTLFKLAKMVPEKKGGGGGVTTENATFIPWRQFKRVDFQSSRDIANWHGKHSPSGKIKCKWHRHDYCQSSRRVVWNVQPSLTCVRFGDSLGRAAKELVLRNCGTYMMQNIKAPVAKHILNILRCMGIKRYKWSEFIILRYWFLCGKYCNGNEL